MVLCASCGREISTQGLRKRDHAYHLRCAPDDLLSDAGSEWQAIFNRGVTYFVKKYSVRVKRGGRRACVDAFASMGEAMSAESKRRKK